MGLGKTIQLLTADRGRRRWLLRRREWRCRRRRRIGRRRRRRVVAGAVGRQPEPDQRRRFGDDLLLADHDLAIVGHANITSDATSPSSATVTYTAPAVTDADDESAPAALCTRPSGSKFAIGTTTVTCTATDSDDTNSPVSTSFAVTAGGAAGQLVTLYKEINGLHHESGLASVVRLAQRTLASGHTQWACLLLTEFEVEIAIQVPWSIRFATAITLIADATRIQVTLGC